MIKNIVKIGAILACAMPIIANASLVINNNTNHDSTSVINSGICSKYIPGGSGITPKHSTNNVGDLTIKLACGFSPHNCKADVYMTDNCTGSVVATVVIDTSTGIKSISNNNVDGYKVSGSGFTINLDGGPATAKIPA